MGFIYALRSEQEKTKHTSFWAIHFCVPVMGALLFLAYYSQYASTADSKKLKMILEITTTFFPVLISVIVGLNVALEEKSLITSLIKQGRIIYDKEHDLLCDSQQSAENPDYAIITCFWVLLDFKKGVVYHTSGEFPIKLNFFSQDEQYEIIYIGEEQEALINHVMESIPSHGSKRLIVLESESQAAKITIDDVAAYCLVNESGAVSYYMRK